MAATPGFTNYSMDEVSAILGPIIMDGFAEGEGLSIEHDSPGFTKYVGCDGRVSRAKTLNRCTKVIVRLAQTSATNDQFTALYLADLLTPGGAGVVPLAVIDRSGRSVHESTYAWISEPPTVSYSNGIEMREWAIETAAATYVIGGN
jgi:hypothetical protein